MLEYIYLLLLREEHSYFFELNRKLYSYQELVDLYAFTLRAIFKSVPLHESGLKLPLNIVAGAYWQEMQGLNFEPSAEFRQDLLDFNIKYRFPQSLRRKHTYILGITGSGKTQFIQQLITYDLDSNASLIVIDSQGDLINNLKRSRLIDPERLVIIDPVDSVLYPLALNMFDVKHLDDPVEHERHLNGVVELLNFVFSAVMDSSLTDKQSVLFNFCIRLMIATPNATIETLVDVLEHGLGSVSTAGLPPIAQKFFRDSFDGRDFRNTRMEVVRRLYSLLENPTISRIFKSPKNHLDISREMDRGKVILISTDRSLLKRSGCAFFGRYFLSLIAQAMQNRANRPPEHRRKCYVYIDECGDYLSTSDVNITDILEKGRKYNVSLTLAHQQIRQLPDDVFHSIKANTAIKLIGQCSASDRAVMEKELGQKYLAQAPLLFSTNLYGNLVHFKVEPGILENSEQRTDEEIELLMVNNRTKYSSQEVRTEPHTTTQQNIEEFNKLQS